MRPRIGFRRLAAAGAAAAIGVASTIVLASSPAQASPSFGYGGFSHGTYVYTGIADHGPQVSSFFGCTRKVGIYRDNELATANVNRQAIAKTVETKTYSHNDARGDGTTSEGSAANIKVGDLIQLVGAKTQARAVYKNGGFQTTGGTTFAAVKIGGVSLPALLKPAPNTKIAVPGLGYVVFNRVITRKTAQSAYAHTAAVLIHSTIRNSYLPKGATVAVLLTKAEVGGPGVGLLKGKAYTTQVNVGDLVKSGPTSLQTTCMGTNGKTNTVSIAGITLPGVGSVHGVTTSQNGAIRKDLASVWFSSGVAGVNLGNGQLQIGAVTSKALATKTKAGKYSLKSEAHVLWIKAGGRNIPIPQAPNQKITIPGIGTITFNKVVKKGNHIAVTALEIHLTAINSTVRIAHSEAGIVG